MPGSNSSITSFSRAILATFVVVSVLAMNVPVATASSGTLCTLACCAGRAPHAAGSCMNGACHAAIARHNRRFAVLKGETFCGSERVLRSAFKRRLPISTFAAANPNGTSSPKKSDAPQFSSAILLSNCQPECGSAASSSVNQNRQRSSALDTRSDRVRPPSPIGRIDLNQGSVQARRAMRRRSVPRGPPLFFS